MLRKHAYNAGLPPVVISHWWSVYTPLGVAKANFAGFRNVNIPCRMIDGPSLTKLPEDGKGGGQPTAASRCMALPQFQTMESVCTLWHKAAGVGM